MVIYLSKITKKNLNLIYSTTKERFCNIENEKNCIFVQN